MGGVRKVDNNQNPGQTAISIAISLSSGLGDCNFGPQANAFAGGGMPMFAGPVAPGGLGSFCGCPCGHNMGAMNNNFGGPQDPFQAGFQQGMMQAKMQRLMRKMHRLMAQMNGGMPGGPGGYAFGGPQAYGSPFGNAYGGGQAFAGNGVAVAQAGNAVAIAGGAPMMNRGFLV